MKAKYSTTCAGCGRRIREGEDISMARGRGARHWTCPADVVVHDAATAEVAGIIANRPAPDAPAAELWAYVETLETVLRKFGGTP